MLRSLRHENVHTDIFTPRTYQVELLDKALKRNTIVCLSKSSGKTFIAVLLIKEIAHEVRSRNVDNSKNTIFLVEKGYYIKQHAHVIRLHTDLSVGEYDDLNKVQQWSKHRWKEELQQHNVLVTTSAIFKELLTEKCIGLAQVNVLIMDECQHVTSDNHPYRHIMNFYKECHTNKPRILGLTCSVLKKDHCKTPTELEEKLNALENALDSTAETAFDVMLAASFNAKPQEFTRECEKYVDQTGLVEQFQNIIASAVYFIENCNISFEGEEKDPKKIPLICFREIENILNVLGPWGAGRVAEALTKQLEKLLEHEKREWPRRLLQFTRTQLLMIDKILTDVFDNDVLCLEDFLLYMTPKVCKLVELLHDYKPEDNFMIIGDESFDENSISDQDDDGMSDLSNDELNEKEEKEIHYVAVKKKPDGQDSSDEEKDETLYGLVFVDRCHTVYALNKLIEELCIWDLDLYFVKNNFLTGHGVSRGGKAKGECEVLYKQQEDILRKFRQREYNLLIATGILEEGVDVPKCNLVVRFSLPINYRSYVQSKGRARAPNSKYYMLIDEPSIETFNKDLDVFRGFEKLLCHKLQEAEKEEKKLTPSEVNKLLPPYKPDLQEGSSTSDIEERSSMVTLSNAIALVNRYCAKLPSDAFTHLVPKCVFEEVFVQGEKKFRATLQLPINSPVKQPIQGELMGTLRLAQMAVALKTCEVLHKEGELDNQFMPIGKEMIRYPDEDNEWEETEASGQARPGTTKRKQYYLKRTATSLVGQPKPGKPCFLYVFNMTLTCPISEEQNTRGRKLHAPEETPRGFGVISDKRIPLVPHFPVFTRSGEVTVAIDLIHHEITFNENEIQRLLGFHRFVFSKVLRLEKDPMLFKPNKASSSYIILPLTFGKTSNDVTIDWGFISKIEEKVESGHKCIFKENKEEKFEFRTEDFEDAVVMPSYRNIDQPQYFYVAEIREDLSPKSQFPSPELFDTFEHYYKSRYDLSVTNLQQPLLDVDHTSARLNLLTPRYMNQKGVALPTSSAETRRAKRENLQQKQILVPELCDIHPFPASLWRKAVCIPAILYRINYLLIAEEIRILIANEAHIGVVHVADNFRFPKVEFIFPSNSDEKEKEKDIHSDITENETSSCKTQVTELEPEDNKKEHVNITQQESKDCSSLNTEPSDSQGSISCSILSPSSEKVNANVNKLPDNSTPEVPVNRTLENSEKKDISIVISKEAKSFHESTREHIVSKEESNNSDITGLNNEINQDECLENVCNCNKLFEKVCKCDNVNVCCNTKSEASPKHLNTSALCHCNNMQESTDLNAVNLGPSITNAQTCNKCDDNHKNNTTSLPMSTLNNEVIPKNCDTEKFHVDSTELSAKVSEEGNWSHNETANSIEHVSNINISSESKKSNNSDKLESYRPKITFDDERVDLENFIGPSPNIILQTLTMSNANDFFNLERLETIGDSFLKFAITVYLYCTYPGIHEGKLSYLRSKQVSNYSLYRLGKTKGFPECMVASKFEPSENWLPPGFIVKREGAFQGLEVYVAPTVNLSARSTGEKIVELDEHGKPIVEEPEDEEDLPIGQWDYKQDELTQGEKNELASGKTQNGKYSKNRGHASWREDILKLINKSASAKNEEGDENKEKDDNEESNQSSPEETPVKESALEVVPVEVNKPPLKQKPVDNTPQSKFHQELEECTREEDQEQDISSVENKTLIPYNLQTQHSLPDKSIADCVEALIGCYLTTCGQKAALEFMSWLGLKVLPTTTREDLSSEELKRTTPFGLFEVPPSPLLTHVPNHLKTLNCFLDGYEAFEEKIQYKFKDRSYLLQSFTHASYHYNNITDCYQRLEFLGDAILDYVITRHLFEDSKKHSPGILTDLRSALVNNNIFAALAVKWDFHKYFKAVSPHLFVVINKFVQRQKERDDEITLEDELEEEEGKEEEDIEIPKALGDIFESVAGAIYLDSGLSLDAVWTVYYRIMKPYIDAFTAKIPKSPVRELLEMEPETAKFERPERTMDGKIRVTVTVVGKDSFRGVGRNYRIAKSAAARRALKYVRMFNLNMAKEEQRQRELAASLLDSCME